MNSELHGHRKGNVQSNMGVHCCDPSTWEQRQEQIQGSLACVRLSQKQEEEDEKKEEGGGERKRGKEEEE